MREPLIKVTYTLQSSQGGPQTDSPPRQLKQQSKICSHVLKQQHATTPKQTMNNERMTIRRQTNERRTERRMKRNGHSDKQAGTESENPATPHNLPTIAA